MAKITVTLKFKDNESRDKLIFHWKSNSKIVTLYDGKARTAITFAWSMMKDRAIVFAFDNADVKKNWLVEITSPDVKISKAISKSGSGFAPLQIDIGTALPTFNVKVLFRDQGRVPSGLGNVTATAFQTFNDTFQKKYKLPPELRASAVIAPDGTVSFNNKFILCHDQGFPKVKISLSANNQGVLNQFPANNAMTIEFPATAREVTQTIDVSHLSFAGGQAQNEVNSAIKEGNISDAQTLAESTNTGGTTISESSGTMAKRYTEEQDALLDPKVLPPVKGFYSKAEAVIYIYNPDSDRRVDYENNPEIGRLPISDLQWDVSQRQEPIYGFASVNFDYLSYGRALAIGNFLVNIGDYKALDRMISNGDPFGYHYGEYFDIEIVVGDEQFHRGIQEWYKQVIHISKARISRAAGEFTLSGEPGAVMYQFVARKIEFRYRTNRMSDIYQVEGLEELATPPSAAGVDQSMEAQNMRNSNSLEGKAAVGGMTQKLTLPGYRETPYLNIRRLRGSSTVVSRARAEGTPGKTFSLEFEALPGEQYGVIISNERGEAITTYEFTTTYVDETKSSLKEVTLPRR